MTLPLLDDGAPISTSRLGGRWLLLLLSVINRSLPLHALSPLDCIRALNGTRESELLLWWWKLLLLLLVRMRRWKLLLGLERRRNPLLLQMLLFALLTLLCHILIGHGVHRDLARRVQRDPDAVRTNGPLEPTLLLSL